MSVFCRLGDAAAADADDDDADAPPKPRPTSAARLLVRMERYLRQLHG
jgi:hypothetical protein